MPGFAAEPIPEPVAPVPVPVVPVPAVPVPVLPVPVVPVPVPIVPVPVVPEPPDMPDPDIPDPAILTFVMVYPLPIPPRSPDVVVGVVEVPVVPVPAPDAAIEPGRRQPAIIMLCPPCIEESEPVGCDVPVCVVGVCGRAGVCGCDGVCAEITAAVPHAIAIEKANLMRCVMVPPEEWAHARARPFVAQQCKRRAILARSPQAETSGQKRENPTFCIVAIRF